MTFLEAALEVLRLEGKPLHYKELTERVIGKKLLTFVGRTPEVTMQTQLTAAVKKAPGNPFVRVKPGIFGLLRYPEVSAEERAAAAAAAKPAEEPPKRERARTDDESAPSGDRGRRRRRGGRGREGAREGGRDEGRRPAPGAATGVSHPPTQGDEGEADEPIHGGGLSAEARAAALAETGVLEGDDDAEGDEEAPRAMDQDEIGETDETAAAPPATGAGAPADGRSDEGDEGDDGDEGDEGEGTTEAGGERTEAGPEGRRPEGELGPGRRRRRRRRRGGRGEGEEFGDSPRPPAGEPALAAPAGDSPAFSSSDPSTGASSSEAGGAPALSGSGDNGQGPRRIMTPVDAALEILRGQAPGRGTAVRQIADMATRRRLVHGEPNEAWRVMRTALAAEPRERLRAGMRPRVRAAGAGLFALSRRPPEAELERAEQVFGEAKRALRERTLASLERRLSELPASAFEALTRVLLQREGFGPATFVKRIEETVYVEALRGRGGRSSRCLIGLRFGPSSGGRRAIGELRVGIEKRGQDEGLLMLAGRLAEDAIAAWKAPGPPIEIADGPALAETCIRHGVGVINAMVSVDFVDADFFAEIAEG